MRNYWLIVLAWGFVQPSNAQRDLELVLKATELVINGYTQYRLNQVVSTQPTMCCIKNKLSERIIVRMIATDDQLQAVSFKEVVVLPKKTECMLDLDPRLYTYEVRFLNGEIFKKGDILLQRKLNMTIKP